VTAPRTMQWAPLPDSRHRIRTTPVTGDTVHYAPRDGGACMAALVTSVSGKLVSLQAFPAPLTPWPDSDDLVRVRHDQGTLTAGLRESAGSPLPLITCDDLSFDYRTWHFIPHPEVP
jgi:hypothetical protein